MRVLPGLEAPFGNYEDISRSAESLLRSSYAYTFVGSEKLFERDEPDLEIFSEMQRSCLDDVHRRLIELAIHFRSLDDKQRKSFGGKDEASDWVKCCKLAALRNNMSFPTGNEANPLRFASNKIIHAESLWFGYRKLSTKLTQADAGFSINQNFEANLEGYQNGKPWRLKLQVQHFALGTIESVLRLARGKF